MTTLDEQTNQLKNILNFKIDTTMIHCTIFAFMQILMNVNLLISYFDSHAILELNLSIIMPSIKMRFQCIIIYTTSQVEIKIYTICVDIELSVRRRNLFLNCYLCSEFLIRTFSEIQHFQIRRDPQRRIADVVSDRITIILYMWKWAETKLFRRMVKLRFSPNQLFPSQFLRNVYFNELLGNRNLWSWIHFMIAKFTFKFQVRDSHFQTLLFAKPSKSKTWVRY